MKSHSFPFATLLPIGLLTCAATFSCANTPAQGQNKLGWADKNIAPWPAVLPPEAVVTQGATDIKWAPLPYKFEAGASPRYIDYENGDDARAGTSTATAWKHHPWDARATGKAAAEKGARTYVFKGGVAYRGSLEAKESGAAGAPIRLTRDPNWGDGPAILSGSEELTGWSKLSDADGAKLGLPAESSGKVWAAPFSAATPRALWMSQGAGERQRMNLARWPNWKIEHPYNHFTQWFRVESFEKGFPTTKISAPKVLKGLAPDALQGATIWIDQPVSSAEFSIMGPVPSSVTQFNPQNGSLNVELNHPVRLPTKNSPFFLENKASFLDEAGEWYFDKSSKRVLVRLPADADPSAFRIEAAAREVTLNIVGQKWIEVAGLTFAGGNVPDLNKAVDNGGYQDPERTSEMAAIRLAGDCQNISLHHLAIEDTGGSGIANLITNAKDVVQNIEISDSRFEHIDNEAISLNRGLIWRATGKQPKGRLTQLRIFRNSMFDIGMRASVPQGGQGMQIIGPEVADIAGNVIERVAAQGINIQGGRPSGGWLGEDAADTPLVRIQVRQNKVKDALFYKSDFGNIEFWANGPAYIYNNLSINPLGWVAHRNTYQKNEAFYFDHGIKGYLFNNIGWSERRADAYKGIVASTFFNEIRTRSNAAFHNTSADFRVHYTNIGAHGEQNVYLGNLMMDAGQNFIGIWQFRSAKGSAVSHNLGAGEYEKFYQRFRGEGFRTAEGFREGLAKQGNMVAKDVGLVSDVTPVINEEKRDFRLTDTSPAIDRGVKMWVPWALSGVVGEWDFRLVPESPDTVLGDDIYAQDFYINGGMFHADGSVPANNLQGEGFATADYTTGALEDWNQGAVRFDGTKSFRLTNAKLIKDFKGKNRSNKEVEFKGTDRKTVQMQSNNFLIETVLRVAAGKGGGTIAAKAENGAGYALGLNAQGALELKLSGATLTAATPINDGVWHHVLVEVDRAQSKATFYVDGVAATSKTAGAFPASEASLENGADFVVGAGLSAEVDFLRVARGTLADAQTNIGELMSWQFNGPHLHDFVGRAATGGIRDIGALEHPTISRVFPVVYTPPADAGDDVRVAANTPDKEDGNKFLDGPTRNVKAETWGSISVPKAAKPGDEVQIQVAFATESVAKEQMLYIDLHGFIDGKRVTGLGAAKPVTVVPGVTTPYSAGLPIPKRDGLTKIMAVVYVTPDKTFKNKTLYGSAEIDISDSAPAQSAAPAPKKAAQAGDKKPAQNNAAAPMAAGTGTDVTDKLALSKWSTGTVVKDVAADNPNFKTAKSVTVEEKPENFWNADVFATHSDGLKKDDPIQLEFWLRAPQGNGSAKVQFTTFEQKNVLFLPTNGFGNVEIDNIGPEWKRYSYAFKAKKDIGGGQTRVRFFLGDKVQTVEIGGVKVKTSGDDKADTPTEKKADAPQTAAAQKPAQAAPMGEGKGTDVTDKMKISKWSPTSAIEEVAADNPNFKTAQKVVVKEKPENFWNADAYAINATELKKNDDIKIEFWLRAPQGDGSAKVQFTTFEQKNVLFLPTSGFGNVEIDNIGPEWKRYSYAFKAKKDIGGSQTRLRFLLGDKVQTVEIGGVKIEVNPA